MSSDNNHAAVPQPEKPAESIETKPNIPCKRWKFAEVDFARADNVKFKLWIPADETPTYSSSSSSSSDNNKTPPPTTTFDAEVDSIGWTKLETETLLELHQRFHGCLAVIVDRWPNTLVPRTILELKERLYAMLPSSPSSTQLDFTSERTRLDQIDSMFRTKLTSEEVIQQHVLLKEIETLQQELLVLRTETLPTAQVVPPTSRLEVKALEVRDEDFSSTNCWMRSNLLDPRFLQVVTAGGAPGGGKDTMVTMYEILNLLQVPMDPMPTALVCEAHGALKRDTLKLLAFKRQIERMNKQIGQKVKVEPSDNNAMFDPVPIEDLKRTMSDTPQSANKKVRIG